MFSRLIRLSFLLIFASAVGLLTAQPVRDIGTVDVAGVGTIAVKVSGATTELDQLANLAFNAHGRYRRVTSGEAFAISFAPAGPNQVRVDVRRGATAVTSQVVNGSSTRNALLRAADVAVRATSNLPGFFASRLAFISERTGKPEVYTGDLFFGEVRQLTSDNAQALTPRWSPDGSRILYTSYFRSGFPDIFQIDLNTLQRTTFVSFKGTNSGARFSPDGRQVVMILSGEGNPEVYVSNAQGRQVSRRTRTANAVESSPSFSPDGSQIVFTSDAAGGPQLYVMPAAGGSPRRLATNISGYCAEPDWNRVDANKIVFTIRQGRGFQVAVHDMSGRTPTTVVSSKIPSTDVIEPSWLPDGRHIVCTARAANQRALWIVDTETGKATRISPAAMGQASQASVLAP
jgi:TolB protein